MRFSTFSGILAAGLLVLAGLSSMAPAAAQEEAAVAVSGSTPLDEATQAQLDAWFKLLDENTRNISELEVRASDSEGLRREVLEARLDKLWGSSLVVATDIAKEVASQRDAGFATADYETRVLELFKKLPKAVTGTISRIGGRIEMPDSSAPAIEQAAVDQRFFKSSAELDTTYNALLGAVDAAELFSIDVSVEDAYLRERIAGSVANSSVYLDIAIADLAGVEAGLAALPEDAELLARQVVMGKRVAALVDLIERDLSMMEKLELPTAQYRQQLLATTGKITTGTFDSEVIMGLLREWGQGFTAYLVENGPGFLFQLFIFLLIIYVAFKFAGLAQKAIDKAIVASGASLSQLLRRMISTTTRSVIIIFGILIALSQVGISLGPLLAGLGIAGFVLGFALQDSLSNFASGLLILLYRPFDVGDVISSGGVSGRVNHMSLVNTTILTLDNQTLIIPNNKIWQETIMNITAQTKRRVDLEFGVSYSDDIEKVEKILHAVVAEDKRVLKDPEVMIKVGSFGDSSVNFLCRPWVETDDYWDVLWDLNRAVKLAFDREGISIPFPQRDVHVFHQQAAAAGDDDSLGNSDSDSSEQSTGA